MTTNSININQANQAEIITDVSEAILDGQADGHGDGDTLPAQQAQVNDQGKKETENRGKPESELRAAARRHGYTLKELAALMGVPTTTTCAPWPTGAGPGLPKLRERVMAVLGEVPGQGIVYRQGSPVTEREQRTSGSGPGRRA